MLMCACKKNALNGLSFSCFSMMFGLLKLNDLCPLQSPYTFNSRQSRFPG